MKLFDAVLYRVSILALYFTDITTSLVKYTCTCIYIMSTLFNVVRSNGACLIKYIIISIRERVKQFLSRQIINHI